MRLSLRVVLIGLMALVAIGSLVSLLAGLPTATPKPSDGKSINVTLVVDFGAKSGRETIVRELKALPESTVGWDLFQKAGITAQGTDQYPTGFLCRLNGWPSTADQDCQDTPKYGQGHWAYFVTNQQLGSNWLLSGQGAAMHHPDCGGYEGWLWVAPGEKSDSAQPRVAPTPSACR